MIKKIRKSNIKKHHADCFFPYGDYNFFLPHLKKETRHNFVNIAKITIMSIFKNLILIVNKFTEYFDENHHMDNTDAYF